MPTENTAPSIKEDGCSMKTITEIRNTRKGGEEKIRFPLVGKKRDFLKKKKKMFKIQREILDEEQSELQ